MKLVHKLIVLILLLSVFSACSQDRSASVVYENSGYHFPFDLSKTDQSWMLPSSLVEISGISWTDDQQLACIQDEKGIIYIFNPNTGQIDFKVPFEEDGDYEDIEIIHKDAWVLKSNGTLFKVENYMDSRARRVSKFPTALSGKNDAEGLAYDPATKTLLIACKENPFVDDRDGSGYKAIYRFSLETNQLVSEPFLLISLDTVEFYKGGNSIKPSGIAIHPVTGDVYVLASAGKLLLVLTRKGEILAMIKLDQKLFRQPEGICFSPEGVLFISNEGAGQEGTIVKYNPQVR
jgi:uncharacterized protein YjiK